MDRDLSQIVLAALEAHGYDFFTGVPCSYLAALLHRLDADPRYGYVSAVREDSAIGIAAGAYLGGRQPVVLMQNSGLGVSVNALTSLSQIYHLPMLLVVSWRGERGQDAPEHLVMGACLLDLLRLLTIPYEIFDAGAIEDQLGRLTRIMRETGRPVTWVIPKGVLERPSP